jgi:dienelactone hydrolase
MILSRGWRHLTAATGATVVLLSSALTGSLAAQTSPAPPAEQRARALVDLLVKLDVDAVIAQFDDKLTSLLPADRLRTAWAATIQQFGDFRRQTSARTEMRGAITTVVVTCEFARQPGEVTVSYDAAGKVTGLFIRPATPPYSSPAYAVSGSYTEEELTIGSAEWPLPATLTVPVGTGPFPVVVLVHGSGPNDRDETVGANKPFKDLALGLASRGVAVLRFEKRTRVHGAKLATILSFTVKEEAIDDALAAVAKLRTTPRIEPTRIFVLGHSLGGMLVPRIAQRDSGIAGFIVMAGAVRPIEDAMLAQTRYLATADGVIAPAEQVAIDAVVTLGETVRKLTPADAAKPALISGAPASYWLDLRGYDSAAAATKIQAPMLILQGERDYQVTMADDFAKWKAALGSTPTVILRTYPALNHLFIAGSGPSLPAEYLVAGHVDEPVIRDIAAWVAALRR